MSHRTDLDTFQKKIGVVFRERHMLERAFTHRSYLHEHPTAADHNELLEFLGDAALEWVVTQYLVRKHRHEEEGRLTDIRAQVVNGATLADVAERLGLAEYLRVSRGGTRELQDPKIRGRLLANTLEALIGAIVMDRGLATAELFVIEYLLPICDEVVRQRAYHNPKSYLQEIAQQKLHVTPHYETLEERGPDHARIFTVGCFVGARMLARGTAGSKADAETAAARSALREEFRVELAEMTDVLSTTAGEP